MAAEPLLPIIGYGNAGVRFIPDTSDVDIAAQRLHDLEPQILARVSKAVAEMAKLVLAQTFIDAMERLSYDQFAPEFRSKILENVSRMPIVAQANPNYASVEIDFGVLGGKDDLEKAFHRHALLREGRHLGSANPLEPYTGQELAIPDADDRHVFFEAMLYGDLVYQAKDGRLINIEPGLWERTKQEYLAIWGDKSPQWLYLQYGQTLYEPKIPPSNLIENFKEDFNAVATLVYEQEFQAALAIANPEEFGITRTPVRGFLQAPSGGISIRGRTYKGGQFTPRTI